MTAPLQVCDLQVQAGQHGQVLLLQEGDPSPHTGHLLLQVPLIHGSVPAQPARRCWAADGRFLLQDDRFEKRKARMLILHLHHNHSDCAYLCKTQYFYCVQVCCLVYF